MTLNLRLGGAGRVASGSGSADLRQVAVGVGGGGSRKRYWRLLVTSQTRPDPRPDPDLGLNFISCSRHKGSCSVQLEFWAHRKQEVLQAVANAHSYWVQAAKIYLLYTVPPRVSRACHTACTPNVQSSPPIKKSETIRNYGKQKCPGALRNQPMARGEGPLVTLSSSTSLHVRVHDPRQLYVVSPRDMWSCVLP